MIRRDFIVGATMAAAFTSKSQAEGYMDRPIGLILIGASWCPFCKSAAQTLHAAAEPVRLPVLVASHDGKPIPPFEEFVDARGHPIASKFLKWPSLVFVHLPTQQVIAEIEGFKNPRAYLGRIRTVLEQAREAGYA